MRFEKNLLSDIGQLQFKRKGIRVNAVASGSVPKETFGKKDGDESESPLKRNASTKEIVSCCLFLTINSSASITDQLIASEIIVNS